MPGFFKDVKDSKSAGKYIKRDKHKTEGSEEWLKMQAAKYHQHVMPNMRDLILALRKRK